MLRNHDERGKSDGGKIMEATVFGIGILSIIAVLGMAVYMLYQDLARQLYQERQTRLNEIAKRTGRVMETDMDRGWNQMEKGLQVWMEDGLAGRDGIWPSLQEAAVHTDDSAVYLVVDSEGCFYSSDGQYGKWRDEDLLSGNAGERRLALENNWFESTDAASLVYLTRLSEEIAAGDVTITHFAMVQDAGQLKSVFFQSDSQDFCPLYIIGKEGESLYCQGNAGQFVSGQNLVQALGSETFLYGENIEKLRENIIKKQQGSMAFIHEGTIYFVASIPLADSQWSLLLFVPASRLGYGDGRFVHTVVACFGGMAAFVIFLTAYMVYMLVHLQRSRKLANSQSRANVVLARTAEEAREANDAKSIFLSHMSHDIRTPINGIIGMTDIALRDVDDPERIRYCLRTISDSSRHLISLVNDVLDISRIEQGKMTVSQDSIDLEVLMENCASIIRGQLIRRRINLIKQMDHIVHARVTGDELHLRQVLINILGNAVKFTPDGGTIRFGAEELEGDGDTARFRFEIRDDGVGMSEEFQKSVFEPFAQEDNHVDHQGSGLGMYITKQFVELMGGTIEVESHPGEGSLFIVELSMVVDRSQPEAAATEELKSLEEMKVLLVEDNPLNMEIARCILEEEKVEVTAAVNGKEAVEYFEQSDCHEIDLILMDVVMPVMDGIAAARCIRRMSRPDARTVPIIAMTANAYTEDVRSVLDAGMNMHIAKPVEVNQLIKILSRYKK